MSSSWYLINKKYLTMSKPGQMRAKRHDGQWRTFSLAGQLPKTAAQLAILGNVYLNGTFGYDDFKLEVETSRGKWQPLPVLNGDFEAARTDSTSGFPNAWRPLALNAAYRYRTAQEASGNHFLEIIGQGAINYGHNAAAGHTVGLNGIKLYYETYGQGASRCCCTTMASLSRPSAARFPSWPSTIRSLPWTPAPRTNRPTASRRSPTTCLPKT
jgi:hypothetical protein